MSETSRQIGQEKRLGGNEDLFIAAEIIIRRIEKRKFRAYNQYIQNAELLSILNDRAGA